MSKRLFHNPGAASSAPTMLDRPTLIQRIAAGEQFGYVFFWGHSVPKDGSVGKTRFSQWYPAPFTVDGILYPTAEHWMMAAKALVPVQNETKLRKVSDLSKVDSLNRNRL